MTGLVRKASILVVLGLVLSAAAAMAGIPDPAHSTCPNLSAGHYFVDIVACKSGVIDPYGAFCVTVRDVANNPVPGCDVKLCTTCSDIKYSQIAGVSCGPPECITAVTNANGVACFDLPGASTNTNGINSGCRADGGTIYACNIELCVVTLTAYDENGAATNPGVEVTDLSALLGDIGKAAIQGYRGRSDFSHSNTLDVVDLSKWLSRIGSTNSKDRCAIYCP